MRARAKLPAPCITGRGKPCKCDLVGLLLPAQSLSLSMPDDSEKRVRSSAVKLLVRRRLRGR
jgi:hypothetical protein